jgi:IS5 family transposase
MRYHQNQSRNLFSADERLNQLDDLGDPLQKLSKCIDFNFFRPLLEESLYSDYDGSKGGRPPFDPVVMLKILVLSRLYNLSDDALEFQIKDRLSFMRFLGIDFGSVVPDAKTIWAFRDQLQRQGLVKQLFDHMNADLVQRNIIAKAGRIVDATIVEVPRQRNTREENAQIKAGQLPEEWAEGSPHRLCQKDVDARWVKKGDVSYYGYKDHVVCDVDSKLIVEYVVTDASVHDSQPVEEILSTGIADDQPLYADSAYSGAEIEVQLQEHGIESRVHEKAMRNYPLTERQKASNKSKSRKRVRIEHIFGFMTNTMKGIVVRGCSKGRNEVLIGLNNLTYNLCRVAQLKKELVPTKA